MTSGNQILEATGKKIRVCFISPKAYPLFNPAVEKIFGGAEVDLYLIATELAKDEAYDVRFVVGDYGQPDAEVRENVTLHKSLDVEKNFIAQGWKVWRALKRADADIYMHEASSLGTTLIALFSKLHGRRFVYRTAHTYETEGEYFKEFPFRGPFVKWAFRQANPMITQNDQDVQSLMRTQQLGSIVIRNACRIRESLPAKEKMILWVARSLPIKRPDLFLKLAREFPEERFVMICPRGVGDDRYDQLTADAETISNLEFIERVPFHEIDAYFERARVFVCTSDAEGFPNTFVQSSKAATAILSLNVNPDDFLTKNNCGFYAEGDWNAFSATLQEWTGSDAVLALGQNGRAYIKAHNDLGDIIGHYKDIFEAVKTRR